jgi:hypothetical protein
LKKTSVLLAVLTMLLATSSVWAAFEYNSVQSLRKELEKRNQVIVECNQVIVDRDTLITQLDTAIHLAESILKLKPPSDSKYLTTLPDQNNEGEGTKIFLDSTGASYSYLPAYPFATPWFNSRVSSGGYFSSQRAFELTNNRSITLSFWGWWFNSGGRMYGGVTGGGGPALNIGVTVRNDYTSADIGAPIGNRTGSYISSIVLGIRFYSWNGSIVEVPKATGVAAPTASSSTAMGGATFLLGSGRTKQVEFYLSPSASDIEAIDHYEIFVASLSAY